MKNRNLFWVLAALAMMCVPTAFAGEVIVVGPGQGGSATVTNNPPALLDYSTTYPLDSSMYGRNSVYPGYEFAFEGDTIHIWALVYDTTIYDVEHMNVSVIATCGGTGSLNIPLTRVSDAQVQGAGYKASYAGDYVVQNVATVQGNCALQVRMTDPFLAVTTDALTNDLYENVDDLLVNPNVNFAVSSGINFLNMIVNSYTGTTPLFITVGITSDQDRESQGVLGNLSAEVTQLVGNTIPTDIITPDFIRMKGGEVISFTNLVGNPGFIVIDDDVATNGIAGWTTQLYFQIWFAANHYDSSYNGADLWLYYHLV